MTPLVDVRQFTAYRHGVRLFAPVTFALGAGDHTFITGGNGSGKTTLLDSIAGLYWDWNGRIQAPTRNISYFQQTSSHVLSLSLRELAPLVVGFKAARYRELVDSLELGGSEDVLLALLSGGEQQRARLLLALLRRHSVLLLDEPFANLDSASCDVICRELEDTREERAVIIVSHPHDAKARFPKGSVQLALSQY